MDSEHERLLQIATEMLRHNIPDLLAVVLFGSYGTKYETNQSDLDLAVLAKSKLDVVVLWELAQNIAIELKRDVDLIDLRLASVVFRFHILSSGKLIFCSNQKDFDFFENVTFSMYFNFQETRKEILKDYGKSSYG